METIGYIRSPNGPFFPFCGLRLLIKLPNTKKGTLFILDFRVPQP